MLDASAAPALRASASGNTLTVAGKEAGLGDEQQVHVVLNATALCINGTATTRRGCTRNSRQESSSRLRRCRRVGITAPTASHLRVERSSTLKLPGSRVNDRQISRTVVWPHRSAPGQMR